MYETGIRISRPMPEERRVLLVPGLVDMTVYFRLFPRAFLQARGNLECGIFRLNGRHSPGFPP